MKKRSRNFQFTKGKNIVKGFYLTWTDPDPMSRQNNIHDATVNHRNAVIKPIAAQAWAKYSKGILGKKPLLWKITMTAYFPYAKGTMEREEKIQIVERMIFNHLAVEVEPYLHEICQEGANLDRVYFEVECLGDRHKKVTDYDEGFEPE